VKKVIRQYWNYMALLCTFLIITIALLTTPRDTNITNASITRMKTADQPLSTQSNQNIHTARVKTLLAECRKVEILCFKSSGNAEKDDDYGILQVPNILKDMDKVYGKSNTPYNYIPIESEYWDEVVVSISDRQVTIDNSNNDTSQ
jgi:hypothetical protein